ncbi:ABC transporter ATP-binding protein [Rhizobium mayense]|uniref:ABC transporter ATP-binding protein n=1 Tax=Rhizobium mayense TaxID=1312184 RepID=A0ABT7K0G7_9HYPH|nr:ABC transporter ATP-binding protein [Rhizobium mayense]MDL2402105.1 ABC transporter ATP-binding protein [Rhizobium mayense]
MTTLTLQNVTRTFGDTHAVNRLDLDVAEGEFICLLGPSGCGKSTALRMIAGFETPDEGDILIGGASMLDVPPNRRATSMVFQSHALWSHMTVGGNIAFGLKLRRLPRHMVAQKVASALALVGLDGLEKRYPAQLSGGQQQRVALARSLVLEPRILLLDEPFSSLDAHLRIRLRDELKSIQRRLGLTTIFVTHDQEEAMSLADRIVVMNRGAVEQIATPRTVYERPATLFAAGFIGTMTILPSHHEGGQLTSGAFRVPGLLEDDTKEWAIAIRPEDCELTAPFENGTSLGVVNHVAELGSSRIATVVMEDGVAIKAQIGRRQMIVKDDRVGCRINRVLVYRDGRSPVETTFSARTETRASKKTYSET